MIRRRPANFVGRNLETLIMEQPAIERRAVSVADAARALGLGVTSTWRLVGTGEIRALRIGGRTLIPTSELDRLVSGAIQPLARQISRRGGAA